MKATSTSNKDKDFLQCFWDLASDDSSKRIAASVRIVEFVAKNLDEERDYALKRLIKGLGSSRDSARQGFATCLSEFLQLPGVQVDHALELLDDSTKVTGSLKGAEERDFLFSKLFCCIAIIRSGLIKDNKEQQLDILDRLLSLHEGKGWMREVVSDTLLLFCSSLSDSEVIGATLVKLKPLLNVQIADMTAWQISMAIGLQHLVNSTAKDRATVTATWKVQWKAELSELPISVHPITVHIIEELKDTLLAATTGYPKIHKVWEYLISFIFPMDANRDLIPTR
jgi:DNA polymerase phi